MGKPCGCAGSCGCDIRGRNGVKISGTGVAPDTMWVELDASSPAACQTIMTCVGGNLGNGLVYSGGVLSVRLSAGTNQATFGPDGGILVTGAGGGGDSGGQTVANLPTATNSVVGSSWGAGSSMWPEGTREAITATHNLVGTQVRMVHVPVRRTSDEFPICLAEPTMGWYLQDGNSQSPQELDHREHSIALITPGGNPPLEDGGYFGYYADPSKGTPTLGEVMDVLARRAVMVCEVRDTSGPFNDANLIKVLAPQYQAQASLIVVGEPVPSTPSSAPNGPTILDAVAASMSGSGIPYGVVFRTRQQVLDFPPAALTSRGVTWVFVAAELVDPVDPNHVSTQVSAYVTAGFQVMLLGVHRQYQAQRAAALSLRGSLCTDPIYAYGPVSGHRYRRDSPSWAYAVPSVGQHSPWSNTLVGQKAHYRGVLIDDQPNQPLLPADLHHPAENEPYASTYWILAGELSPLRDASTYAVQCWWKWNGSLPPDNNRYGALFFDAPTDRSMQDWSAATAQTVGWELMLTAAGHFTLVEFDGTPGEPPAGRIRDYAIPGYSIQPNTYYGMRVEVTPTAIRLYSSSTTWPAAFNKVLVATVANPHRYISGVDTGYVFFGRHFFTQAGSRDMQIAGLSVQYSGF